MLSPKPTLLIIHGLSHSPAHFAPIINLFSKAGYETVCPQNPTFDSQPPFKNFLDDVAALSTELTKLVEVNEKDVIVIMHSYGGIVGTQAITEVLSKAWREKEGKKGGVVRLLYLCAYVMGMGQSASSLDPGMIPHFITINEDRTWTVKDPEIIFYNDLSVAEQAFWINKLRPHPPPSSTTPITNVAYKYIPTTYLLCEKDQAIPFEVQRMMVAGAEASGDVYEGEIEQIVCGSGHSPFLSMPERVVEIVEGLSL